MIGRGKGSGSDLDTPLIIEDMPGPRRAAEAGLIEHALSWANARLAIFWTDEDYADFQRVLAEVVVRDQMRLLVYCLVPNRFHVLLWPRDGRELSQFMNWLTMTHTQRWHAHHRTAGTGHLDQGPFKSFPVRSDEHFLTVCRDVERNALRANLVGRAEDWRWGSLSVHRTKDDADRPALTLWPIDRPRDWMDRVNRPFGPKEDEAVQRSIQRGQPSGSPFWQAAVAKRLGLESVFRSGGRPPKEPQNGSCPFAFPRCESGSILVVAEAR
jgi:putative transposase